MKSAPWSLRRRLMVTLGAATLALWCATSVWTFVAAYEETERMFDSALDQAAHTILAVVRNEAAELPERRGNLGAEVTEIGAGDPGAIVFQIVGPNGGLVLRSRGAPAGMLAGWHDRGFGTKRVEGTAYRVFSLSTELDALTIHVAQPMARRIESARASALRQLAPGAALMLALMLAVGWSVRRVTAPVVRYAAALDRLSPQAETTVDGSQLPAELRPVARAIERLLARVRDALLRERTLTADAAHELRNPLAALRLQTQVARRAKTNAERNAALDELLAGTDRAARMVEAILTLARLDASSDAQIGRAAVRLDRLAQHVVQEFTPLLEGGGVHIELDAAPVEVRGDEDALAVALRNLLSNAARYARSRIRVSVAQDADSAFIKVLDDGPGFTEETAKRAFYRFYRGPERSAEFEGTGLGLALVLRIAQLHGGSAQIGRGSDAGAELTIVLPRHGAGRQIEPA